MVFFPNRFSLLIIRNGDFFTQFNLVSIFLMVTTQNKRANPQAKIKSAKICCDFIMEESESFKKKKKTKKKTQPNQLTTAWLGQRKQQFRAHSDALFPVFPVLWVRIMAWKQTIRQRQTRGLRSLSQSQQGCQHSTAGWPGICRWFHWLDPCSKSPVTTPSSLSGALKVPVSKHRKQLAAENAARATQKWPWRRLHPVQAGRTLWHCYVFCPLFQR